MLLLFTHKSRTGTIPEQSSPTRSLSTEAISPVFECKDRQFSAIMQEVW